MTGGSFRKTGLGESSNLSRIGGVIRVVINVMIKATLKTSSLINPEERPIPAMIRATSPRGTIPTPILRAPLKLKFRNKAGIPQPISLLKTAKTM